MKFNMAIKASSLTAGSRFKTQLYLLSTSLEPLTAMTSPTFNIDTTIQDVMTHLGDNADGKTCEAIPRS
jgi:hypothetical protein